MLWLIGLWCFNWWATRIPSKTSEIHNLWLIQTTRISYCTRLGLQGLWVAHGSLQLNVFFIEGKWWALLSSIRKKMHVQCRVSFPAFIYMKPQIVPKLHLILCSRMIQPSWVSLALEFITWIPPGEALPAAVETTAVWAYVHRWCLWFTCHFNWPCGGTVPLCCRRMKWRLAVSSITHLNLVGLRAEFVDVTPSSLLPPLTWNVLVSAPLRWGPLPLNKSPLLRWLLAFSLWSPEARGRPSWGGDISVSSEMGGFEAFISVKAKCSVNVSCCDCC